MCLGYSIVMVDNCMAVDCSFGIFVDLVEFGRELKGGEHVLEISLGFVW